MAIKITVNKGEAAEETPEVNKELLITVRKKDQLVEPDAQASVNLAARRTLDGNVLITDHPLIDVLLQPANQKIIAFTKNDYSDETYFAQSRLFDYLSKKGVIVYDSVQGGNVYGTLQAKYPEVEDRSALEAALLTVSKWVNQEKAAEFEISSYEQEVEDLYTNPPEEDSTELGEVPHPEPKKDLPTPLGVRY
tara:strand:+ start:709 stop:1287 length:579 start_codon:yes stop_codon:yes gene_type:complete